jgi:antitoxin component HigA of HigAB toxin-antitoxin module
MAAFNTFLSDTSRLIAGYSAVIGKAFMSFFGSLGALLEFYNIYSAINDKEVAQRKTKISTHILGFGINAFYTAAAITGKVLTYLGLGFVGLAAEIVALTRVSYVLHESRRLTQQTMNTIAKLKDEYNPLELDSHLVLAEIELLNIKLKEQRDFSFKNKVDTAYSTVSVVASGMFIAGLFFTPLLVASFVVFTIAKIMQAYDTYNQYKLSRWFSRAWDALTGKPNEEHDALLMNELEIHQHKSAKLEAVEAALLLTPSNSPSSTALIFAADMAPAENQSDCYGIEILDEQNSQSDDQNRALAQIAEEADKLDGEKIPLFEERPLNRFSM